LRISTGLQGEKSFLSLDNEKSGGKLGKSDGFFEIGLLLAYSESMATMKP
jgi:hypothetical protein